MPSLKTVALAGAGAFVALVALEHPLRPSLPATQHFISEYGNGSTRAVASAAFVAWGVGLGALALAAARERMPVVAAGAVVAVAGTLMDAIWRTQTVAGELPVGVVRTTEGRLHDLGTLLILAGLVVSAVASLWRLRSARWRWSVVGLLVGFLAVPGVLVAAGLDWPGIGQRGIILVGVAYGALAAVELARPGAITPPRRARRTPAPARA